MANDCSSHGLPGAWQEPSEIPTRLMMIHHSRGEGRGGQCRQAEQGQDLHVETPCIGYKEGLKGVERCDPAWKRENSD